MLVCGRSRDNFDEQTTLTWGDLDVGKISLGGQSIITISVYLKTPNMDRVGAGDMM